MSSDVGNTAADLAARNKAIILDFLAAQSDGRLSDAGKVVDPNGSWWMLTERRTATIGEYYALWEKLITNQFPDGLRLDVLDATAEDDRVAVRVESRGVMDDGTDYNNIYFFQFQLRDGLIVRAWEHGDTAHVWKTLRRRHSDATS
ncbi:nuclear transport factor 2 family protein [Streptomyces sp. NPDC001978]|uniref:nuclear transport factor 2 family protein n=1 Tax=Streptomyces sp. NPDC001978 TaxID=3364627 RepID=UPI0036C03598